MPSGRQFERHVGRHLRELALFALPHFDSEEEDSVTSDKSQETEIGRTHEAKYEDDSDTPGHSQAQAVADRARLGTNLSSSSDQTEGDEGGGSITDTIHAEDIRYSPTTKRKQVSLLLHPRASWQDLQQRIRRVFEDMPMETISPHIAQGNYDLLQPNGQLVDSQLWGMFAYWLAAEKLQTIEIRIRHG
ncbi:hypothetical protein N7447_010082 [Penicillium robsamsonii]|uniref:uncharacterized protein n=1 Tax=Penicillium robsamsonii TaxID=1792511 RepID=UPI002549990C|nr:uncharacterized protein N7447_010082 [Penicillium robsamsonii]KAJ5813059.1 hypothetical protein N7447_010082 [Penicillium robsamsonii]